MWIVLLGLLVVGVLALFIRRGGGNFIKRERERLMMQQRRLKEREAAQKVLAGEAKPLAAPPPVELTATEQAYFAAPASLVEQDGGEDEFVRRSEGLLVVTDEAFIYQPEKGAAVRLEADNIGRVDIPLADVLEVVTFTETFARDEQIAYYHMDQPLLAAAHISRFAGFQLVLAGPTAPDGD